MIATRHVTLDGSGDGVIGCPPCRLAGIVGDGSISSLGQTLAPGLRLRPDEELVAGFEIAGGTPGSLVTFYLNLAG